jgi:hypothetical protein
MNRYAHIYMQKLFFFLAGDALTGTRLYWCFLFFSTAVLVYWCARLLAGKKGYMVGIVAALLFCSQPIFFQTVGGTDIDLAVMLLFTLACFVYLHFLVGKFKNRHLIIASLGLIFFCLLKTKETGICMAVLFFALGEEKDGTRNIRRFARDIGWVCVGMFVGSLILMTLDAIFLGDFWFSVRPSVIRGLFNYNIGEFAHDARNRSWYTLLSIDHLIAVFLLYLLVGYKPFGKDRLARHELFVWLIPLSVIFFIIAITIKVTCDCPRRYIFPAIPGFCIWAAQFFSFQPSVSQIKHQATKKFLTNALILLVSFVIAALLMQKMPDMLKNSGWNSMDRFYDYVILPLATTLLLIYAIAAKGRKIPGLLLLFLCLSFIIYHPLAGNISSLKQKVVANRSEYRYLPYQLFADELRFDEDVKILVSKDIHKRTWMLGRAKSSHYDMFNIFFNQRFHRDQFIDGTLEDILKGDYTYAFMTWDDWNGIRKDHDIEHLTKSYIVKTDRATQIILLKKR